MSDSSNFSILAFGDVVARPGRVALKDELPGLRKSYKANFVVANGENASGGLGLDPGSAQELRDAGVDIITLGDHSFQRKEIRPYLDKEAVPCIRPANYPDGAPGKGYFIWKSPSGLAIGVMNLIGRVFFNFPLDCPFKKADELLAGPLAGCDLILCDFHAEATSEKYAMGRYLDGRISLLFGTHTHVQTADAAILPLGTGYITDLGMCGSADGVIGLDSEVALKRFLTGVPESYKEAKGDGALSGIWCEIDLGTKKAKKIELIRKRAGVESVT